MKRLVLALSAVAISASAAFAADDPIAVRKARRKEGNDQPDINCNIQNAISIHGTDYTEW